MRYRAGLGQPADPDRAIPLLLREGCNKGHGRAFGNLDWAHSTGTGLDRDLVQAARCFRLGCDGGSGPACRNLGLIYQSGDGVPQDDTRSSRLFDRACGLGMDSLC